MDMHKTDEPLRPGRIDEARGPDLSRGLDVDDPWRPKSSDFEPHRRFPAAYLPCVCFLFQSLQIFEHFRSFAANYC